MKQAPLKQIVKGELAVIVFRVVSYLPLKASQKLGLVLGRLAYLLNVREVEIARRNFELCFPDQNGKENNRKLRRSFEHAGMLAVETAFVWFSQPKRILPQIKNVSGEHHMQSAVDLGKGVVVVLPHLGNWEMLNAYILSKYPGSAMYKPSHLPAINRVMVSGRERTGLALEEATTKGVIGLFKKLKKGETLFILPDQEPDLSGGVFAPFFGRQALTMTLIPKLVSKSGASVVMAYALRNAPEDGFDIFFEPAPQAIESKDVTKSAKALNEMVESAVAASPEQYMWGYKRFRQQPEGEPSLY